MIFSVKVCVYLCDFSIIELWICICYILIGRARLSSDIVCVMDTK